MHKPDYNNVYELFVEVITVNI